MPSSIHLEIIGIIIFNLILFLFFKSRTHIRSLPLFGIISFITYIYILIYARLISYRYDEIHSDSLEIARIQILVVLLALNALNFLFDQSILGKKANILTQTSQYLTFVLLGLLFSDLYLNKDEFIKIDPDHDQLKIEVNGTFEIFILLAISLSGLGIYFAMQYLFALDISVITYEEKYGEKLSLATFVIGGFTLYITNKIHLELHEYHIFIDIFGSIMLIVGIFLLYRILFNNPFTLLFIKGDVKSLLNSNHIGWVCFANQDDGPDMKNVKTNYLEDNEIKKDVILKFGIQNLMLAYNDNIFTTSIAVSPLPGSNEYLAITVTFIHLDESVQDVRLKHQSLSCFSLLIPRLILPIFSKAISDLPKLTKIVQDAIANTNDIDEFSQNEHMDNLAMLMLNIIY